MKAKSGRNKHKELEERLKNKGYNMVFDAIGKRLRDYNQILLLNHILRQYRMGKVKDGYVTYDRSSFEKLYGISVNTQGRGLKKLEEFGYIEMLGKSIPRRSWYKLNYELIDKEILGEKVSDDANSSIDSTGTSRAKTIEQVTPNSSDINITKYDKELPKRSSSYLEEKKEKEERNGFDPLSYKLTYFFPLMAKTFPSLLKMSDEQLVVVMKELDNADVYQKKEILLSLSFIINRIRNEQIYEKDFFNFIEKAIGSNQVVSTAMEAFLKATSETELINELVEEINKIK